MTNDYAYIDDKLGELHIENLPIEAYNEIEIERKETDEYGRHVQMEHPQDNPYSPNPAMLLQKSAVATQEVPIRMICHTTNPLKQSKWQRIVIVIVITASIHPPDKKTQYDNYRYNDNQ